MDLKDKINIVKKAKDDIKQSIIDKGVTPSGNISTYATAIRQIDTVRNQNKTTTKNGTITFDSGYTGLGQVTVNVNNSVQSKAISSNGTYTPDNGYIGFNSVIVDVQPSLITKTVTDNGTYTALSDNADGYSSFTVNVDKGLNTNLTVNPTTTSQYIEPTLPYTGFEMVTVNAVTSAIDSNIQPSNIKKDVVILGTTGTFEGNTDSSGLNIKMSFDGTLGGDYFAVSASVSNVWKAFDGDNNTSCTTGGVSGFTFIFYSPIKLVLTGIKGIVGTNIIYYIGGTTVISGSNDNINWTQIVRKEEVPLNSQNGITFSNTNAYKYYKFEKLYCSYSPLYTIELTGYFEQ